MGAKRNRVAVPFCPQLIDLAVLRSPCTATDERAPLDHEGLQRVSLRRIAIAGMDIIWYMHII